MRFAGTGRFVWVAQWVFGALLPVFFFLGRGWIGADIGWLAIVGILYGVLTILALCVPPLLTMFDPEARKKRSTRVGYDIASIVLWLSIIVGALTVPDSGDSGHLDSALSTWTGMSYETSAVIFYGTAVVIGLAYLAAFVLAIVGIVRGRQAAS